MIRSRYQTTTSTSRLHDSSSSEDEEEQLLREEQEQERLLSEQHGEANDASSNTNTNSNKRQSDAEIANALNSNAAKRKKPRVTLTAEKLVESRGLIAVRHDFQKVKYRKPQPIKASSKTAKNKNVLKRKQFDREIKASATYIGKLMLAYQEFALDIAPNMHYNDTFHKIQDLGKKTEVKTYLNTMREDICKQHLEKMYGRDRAEKYSNELENGLQASANDDGYYDQYEDVGGTGVSRRLASLESVESAVESQQNSNSNGTSQQTTSHTENDDEEVEASFDDVVPSQTQPNVEEEKDKEVDVFRNDNADGDRGGDLDKPMEDATRGNEDEDGLEEPRADLDDGAEDQDLEEPKDSATMDNEDEDGLEEPRADLDDEVEDQDLEEPKDSVNGEDSLEEPRADLGDKTQDHDDLEEPKADADENFSTQVEKPRDEAVEAATIQPFDIEEARENQDDEKRSVDVEDKDDVTEPSVPIDNSIREISLTQDSLLFDGTQSQSDLPVQMTQDTTFDATQDTLVFDASQTQESQNACTQDTLVFDSSQDADVSRQHPMGGSQDY
jgi:hypothetical protein